MIKSSLIVSILTLTIASTGYAEENAIKAFNAGSYQQILDLNAKTPFILAIWSIDCPSCLKDMDVLYQVHKNHPELNIVMLSTDEPDAIAEVKSILSEHKLDDLNHWLFGTDDAQKLRYEIDPGWYGELPRTYFFNASHIRTGKSGALKYEEFESQISNIAH